MVTPPCGNATLGWGAGLLSSNDQIALFTKIRVSFHVSRNLEQFLNVAGPVAVVSLGRLGGWHMARVVVMAHDIRLLTAALYADEYLVVQIKRTVG